MTKTVQIRDLSDETYAALALRAAEERIGVPELLRREADRLASRVTVSEWLRRTRRRTPRTGPFDAVRALDELRGDWPRDAGR